MSNENVKNFQTKNTLRNICFSPQGRPRDNNFVKCEFNDDYLLCCISLSLFFGKKTVKLLWYIIKRSITGIIIIIIIIISVIIIII